MIVWEFGLRSTRLSGEHRLYTKKTLQGQLNCGLWLKLVTCICCTSHQSLWQSCVLRGDPQHPQNDFFGYNGTTISRVSSPRSGLPSRPSTRQSARHREVQVPSCSDVFHQAGCTPKTPQLPLFFRRRSSWWKPRKIWTWRHHLYARAG